MRVHLTPERPALVQAAVPDGRYSSAGDAIRDAPAHREADERARAELMAALDEAEADLESRRFSVPTELTRSQLARELKKEGRALHGVRGRAHGDLQALPASAMF